MEPILFHRLEKKDSRFTVGVITCLQRRNEEATTGAECCAEIGRPRRENRCQWVAGNGYLTHLMTYSAHSGRYNRYHVYGDDIYVLNPAADPVKNHKGLRRTLTSRRNCSYCSSLCLNISRSLFQLSSMHN